MCSSSSGFPPPPPQLSPPRLLQMMLSTQPGGAETFFEKLGLAFAEAGVPQCLVIEPNAERERLFAKYPHVEVVPIRFGGWREWKARRVLKATFGRFAPDAALTWMNRASRRAPRGCCPIVGRLGGYYKIGYYRRCDHLVGITPDLVAHIRASGWPENASSLIPNFGETPPMDGDAGRAREDLRREFGIGPEDTVLLALGRLHPAKAHDTLIRAMAEVPGTILLLAGEGPLEADLRELARGLGLADRVRFLGWRRDVGALFGACDISVFPSRYEPNGNVVMESWAHRRPLVASRAKGPDWLVDDGVNGLLFDIDSVPQLRDRLVQLGSDPELCARLVRNGEEKWRRGFSREAVVGQYLELFASLARRNNNRKGGGEGRDVPGIRF
ncbi:MAG: glycosyltransferase [Opitutaceae bacterium]|jgi:glycosyltransferase involved in cell wall biosynthesis|nr:glycosyltransferase [Opitutaceae bacterium]